MEAIIIMINVVLFIAALPVWAQGSSPVFLCHTINESDCEKENVEKSSLLEEFKLNNLKSGIVSSDDVYKFRHISDNSTYYLIVLEDDPINYRISVYDYNHNELQAITFVSHPFGISLTDLNLDGYTDLIANLGGTLNEIHELYIWDQEKSCFIKVNYIGFDFLSYFEIEDGYIMNWVKENAVSGSIEKLIWDGNSLVKESAEYYELNDAGQ